VLSSRPAPQPASREGNILGFDSLPALLSFAGLLLLLLGAPSNLSGSWPADYDFWPQALFLLLGAGVSLLLALSPNLKPQFNATTWLLSGFLIWNVLALPTSVYKHDSYLEVARVFGALFTFFAVSSLWRRDRAVWILGAWVLGMLWCDRVPIYEFLKFRGAGQAATFANQNMLANALAMTLPIAAILPLLVRRFTRLGAVVALACLPFCFCALGLLVTSSKGGLLAAMIGLLVTAVLIGRAKKAELGTAVRRNRAAFAGGALLLLLLFGFIGAKTVLPRLRSAGAAQDNSSVFRTYVWRSTWEMARAKPVTGFGPGSFPHVYPQFAYVSHTRHAHQSWSQIAAESGVPSLLLLLCAIAVALAAGAKRLKTQDWPLVAAMSGAVVALLVHGCVDSGFHTTSITIMLAVALAVLAQSDAPPKESAGRLNLFWLGATLLLAVAGNQTQKAAIGEDALDVATDFLKTGAPSMAIARAHEATASDPGSARLWLSLGRWQERGGENGEAALQTAAQLQPTGTFNWANLARHAARAGSPLDADKYYARALECSPLDTSLLLERAQYRLQSKDSRGYDDLKKLLALWDQPIGLYPPVEQIVNLDFARATLLFAPKLRQTGQTAELRSWVKRSLADCQRARSFAEQNAEMRRQTGGEFGSDENDDLETLASSLEQLQTALK
jgi:O-antigen ligase